ncbi:MAG TPA: hypothetical protein VMF63_06715 [Opitutaceae bacterium]|nr:hypothetical protein [Opitutaceae bacterium]
MSEHRTLLMRANRLLGAALVEANLVKIEDLEAANERLLELLATDNERQATLLGVLMYEKKVLSEDDLLHHMADNDGIGLIDLRTYDVPEEFRKEIDLGSCWATWTVPFDKEENFFCVASAYYLSPAVRSHWEKQLGTNIIWYATTLEIISDFLEKVEGEKNPPKPAGAPAVPAAATPAASTPAPAPAPIAKSA